MRHERNGNDKVNTSWRGSRKKNITRFVRSFTNDFRGLGGGRTNYLRVGPRRKSKQTRSFRSFKKIRKRDRRARMAANSRAI